MQEEKPKVKVPRYLREGGVTSGDPVRVPPKAAKVFHCQLCKERLVRRRGWWLCVRKMHGKLMSDWQLFWKLLEAWPKLRAPAEMKKGERRPSVLLRAVCALIPPPP